MKVALSLIVAVSASDTETRSPIGKILETLADCEAKVIKEGEEAQKVYTEFAEWCENRATNLRYEKKTAQAQADGLQATVYKETSNQQALSSQIEDIAADIATDENDLAAATKIRNQEIGDFQGEEKDLESVIDTITRAIVVIEREMSKGGASMMQLKSATSLTQVFKAMVAASTMNTADAQKLTAFVQTSNDEDDLELGAPAAAAYESQSGGIVDVLEGLKDQANEQLDKSRKQEMTASNNYQMLKQSLEQAIKYANEELDTAKQGLAASKETQAVAQGDLDVTQKDLAEDTDTLAATHRTCLTRSQDFETEAKSRSEELRGLALATNAMKQITLRGRGASFLQISSAEEPTRLAVHLVRNLARKQNDQSLAQLASRMNSVLAMSSKLHEDPFAKIKEMMVDSIARLENEQAEDATQKAYCDKEMAESTEKVTYYKGHVEKITTKLEQRTSASMRVKAEVATLQEELSKMISVKNEMDNIRQKEKADYDFNKAEVAQSLSEIRFALKTLRDFYATYAKEHTGFSSSDGTANGVILMLETVEADFSKQVAQLNAVEDAAVAEYTEMSKTFETRKVVKEKGIKYKTKEYKGLDKAASDLTSDREGRQSQLDANTDALAQLKAMCVGKAETYEERVARREEELASLKESLETLESQNAETAEAEAAPAEAAEGESVPAEAPAEAAPEAAPEAAAEAVAEEAPVSLAQRSAKRFRGGVRTRTA